jgi:Ni,Fe-hydrogenase III large subunit
MSEAKQTIDDLLAVAKPQPRHHGAPRFAVSSELWQALIARLGDDLDLMGLWCDGAEVHMALFEPARPALTVVSRKVVDSAYPSVGAHHAPAIRAERTIHDMYGIRATGLSDTRPWLDHGTWPLAHPLAKKPAAPADIPPYDFLKSTGEGLHQIPVGPVHAGIIEPGHFRFTCAGETVVRLEERLGYTHKGIEKLIEGKTLDQAARIAARISGDSTVAYATAFARAAETALAVEIPARAHWMRALMGELERLANHLGDIGAICNDAAFALLHAHFSLLREDVLQTCKLAFGHRLMMDRTIPGGVTVDLDHTAANTLLTLLQSLRDRLPRLIEVYDNTASLQDRTRNSGILPHDLAARFGAGGFVGRASGRDFDTRRDLPYGPYEFLDFQVPGSIKGDVDCRIWLRINEVEQSLSLCQQILHQMPGGGLIVDLPSGTGKISEGIAMVEGFRGDILVWLRLDAKGCIKRCYPRDPSHYQWPLLEAVIEHNIVADFPLCNKSFNCAYSGCDL